MSPHPGPGRPGWGGPALAGLEGGTFSAAGVSAVRDPSFSGRPSEPVAEKGVSGFSASDDVGAAAVDPPPAVSAQPGRDHPRDADLPDDARREQGLEISPAGRGSHGGAVRLPRHDRALQDEAFPGLLGPVVGPHEQGVFFYDSSMPAETHYRTCDGLLNLHRSSDPTVFRTACKTALKHGRYSYRFIRSLVESKCAGVTQAVSLFSPPEHDNIRGREQFR